MKNKYEVPLDPEEVRTLTHSILTVLNGHDSRCCCASLCQCLAILGFQSRAPLEPFLVIANASIKQGYGDLALQIETHEALAEIVGRGKGGGQNGGAQEDPA